MIKMKKNKKPYEILQFIRFFKFNFRNMDILQGLS